MPEHTENRLRWERVPILGSNPVFCFDARRLWTRRTLLVLFLVTLAIAVVAPALGLVSRSRRESTPLNWFSGRSFYSPRTPHTS